MRESCVARRLTASVGLLLRSLVALRGAEKKRPDMTALCPTPNHRRGQGPGSGVVGVRHSPVLAPTHLPGAGGVSPSPGARVRCGREVLHPVL